MVINDIVYSCVCVCVFFLSFLTWYVLGLISHCRVIFTCVRV